MAEIRPHIILHDLAQNAIDRLRAIAERKIETGTVTGSGTETTGTYAGYFYIEDSSKSWSDDIWKDCLVEIVEGTGQGTVAKIVGNSTTRLYLDRSITVDTTSKYAISVDTARESTIQGIKAQTDKLTFDANNNLLIGINADNIGLAKNLPTYPLVIDFSKEWHKELVNADELGAEIVDLSAEGIPALHFWTTKALKFSVEAGETKYLKLPAIGYHEEQSCFVLMYLTGDVTAEWQGAFTGTNVVLKEQNAWRFLVSRLNNFMVDAIKFTATNGGDVYIAQILIPIPSDIIGVHSYPNQTLDGTTTYYYYAYLPHHGKSHGVGRVYVVIAGDGTNACNVDIQVFCATDNQWHTIASFSRVASTTALYQVKFPYTMFSEPQNDIQFVGIRLVVSGYGLFYRYGFIRWKYDKLCLNIGGLKTSSASNVSTTVTRYTLIDNNGRGNRYKQASVTLSSPAGGTAKLYINGQLVADFSGTSGTFDIPDDIDIWKIEVDLAGDGTTAATADFQGLELLGPYIVRR